MDFLPTTGKRSGAYSTGVYGVHPYQLLNFTGQYDEVSTLAHESGHSMHTLLSRRAPALRHHDYSIFVAEVASTLNENLLFHHSRWRRPRTDADAAGLLGSWLDEPAHDAVPPDHVRRVRAGDPPAGREGRGAHRRGAHRACTWSSSASYYGYAQGVCKVDDAVRRRVGLHPALLLRLLRLPVRHEHRRLDRDREAILEDEAQGGTAAPRRYLKHALLRRLGLPDRRCSSGAGVDMTTSAPFQAAIAEMNATMDEMEAILARQPAGNAK